MSPRVILFLFGLGLLVLLRTAAAGPAPAPDPRNFAQGRLIPDENYCDQPRVVVTRDGTWVCVLTTGPGNEGGAGQHIVATRSRDRGRTWSELADVEKAGEIKSSYAIALVTPADRIYAFYCYNGERVHALPNGRSIRDDIHGWFCYRYSEDQGRTWSERHRLPMRVTAADRQNDWQGRVQMFWAIGTPVIFDGTAMFAFTKLGKYILQDGEGWFYRSDNVLEELDPAKLRWELLPEGDCGVRNPEFGSVQEEHDIVHLEGEQLCCIYRTTKGYAASAYTRDGGRTWEAPKALRYRPGGRVVKQPRACAKIWQARPGRYLLWYHNNGTTSYNNGRNAGSRNIAWLSGGALHEGSLHWSEPEIVAYVDGGLEGCSYPDLIADGDRFYICATQKTEARVLEVDPDLLEGLWSQERRCGVASNGLVLDLSEAACEREKRPPAPTLPSLRGPIRGSTPTRLGRGGFSVEVVFRLSSLAPGQVLLDGRDTSGKGYALRTTDRATIELTLSDGWRGVAWDCDPGLIQTNRTHHLVVIVDGGPKVITFVVDGMLCDGGTHRLFGFGRFDPNFGDPNGADTLEVGPHLFGRVGCVRIYNRALRTSEAVGNYRSTSALSHSGGS